MKSQIQIKNPSSYGKEIRVKFSKSVTFNFRVSQVPKCECGNFSRWYFRLAMQHSPRIIDQDRG